MMFKKIHMILVCMVCATCGFAKEIFPKGCEAKSIDQPQLQVPAARNQLVFLHNLSENHIWLANPVHPKMTVEMKPGQWNVLYLPKGDDTWKCIQSIPGHEQQISCQIGMAVCQWSAKISKSKRPKQNTWLAENTSYAEAKAYLQRMGWLFERTGSK